MQAINNFAFAAYNNCDRYDEFYLSEEDYNAVFCDAFLNAIEYFCVFPNIDTDIKESKSGKGRAPNWADYDDEDYYKFYRHINGEEVHALTFHLKK